METWSRICSARWTWCWARSTQVYGYATTRPTDTSRRCATCGSTCSRIRAGACLTSEWDSRPAGMWCLRRPFAETWPWKSMVMPIVRTSMSTPFVSPLMWGCGSPWGVTHMRQSTSAFSISRSLAQRRPGLHETASSTPSAWTNSASGQRHDDGARRHCDLHLLEQSDRRLRQHHSQTLFPSGNVSSGEDIAPTARGNHHRGVVPLGAEEQRPSEGDRHRRRLAIRTGSAETDRVVGACSLGKEWLITRADRERVGMPGAERERGRDQPQFRKGFGATGHERIPSAVGGRIEQMPPQTEVHGRAVVRIHEA